MTMGHLSVQIFSQIETLLEQAGSSRKHMLHVLVHLRSMNDGLQEFNTAWRAWLGDDEGSLPVLDGRCMHSQWEPLTHRPARL